MLLQTTPTDAIMLQQLVPIIGMIGGMTVSIVLGLPIVKMLVRRMERGDRPVIQSSESDTRARLERIEQAVEAIAVEIERISETQRFTTKLLAERSGADKLSAGT